MEGPQRRLAAILAADIVGFSRLVGADEEGTLARQKAIRGELVDPTVQKHHGRIVKSTGDGFLAEFGSAVDAVRCALLIQSAMRDGEVVASNPAIVYRMGINVGDIVIDGDDIFGDGVNIAARLEGEADPGGICISRGVYDHVRGKVEAEFEDLGARALKNIVEPVQVFRLRVEGDHVIQEQVPAGFPTKPSIAILPIANISGSLDLDPFAAGLTEGLVVALARMPELLVVPHGSTGAISGKVAGQAAQPTRQRAATKFLKGSVQGTLGKFRVTLQLIDGTSGNYLWSETYDSQGQDMLALQDDIVRKMLTEVRANITVGDRARIDEGGTRDLNALLSYVQARGEWAKFSRDSNFRARSLFQKVHDAEPNWGAPLAYIAATYREAATRGWSASPESDFVKAEEFAQRAITLDPNDPIVCMHLGALRVATGRTAEGIALCEKAVELAPNEFGALGTLAWNLPRIGQIARALALFTRARKVRPAASGPTLANEGFVAHLAGQRDRGLELLKECAARFDLPDARVRLAGLYVDLGRQEDARAEIARVLTGESDATIAEYTGNLPFPDEAKRDWYVGLLRAAGLPDA